jgi:hypothetical protein
MGQLLREYYAMSEPGLPVALRCQEITEQEVKTLRRLAEATEPRVGVLDWVPQRLFATTIPTDDYDRLVALGLNDWHS